MGTHVYVVTLDAAVAGVYETLHAAQRVASGWVAGPNDHQWTAPYRTPAGLLSAAGWRWLITECEVRA